MTEQEALDGIAEVARAHLGWSGPLSRDLPLVETLELDSLRLLTLVIELEDRFRITLDQRDEDSLCTVGDLLDVIKRKAAGGDRDSQ